MIKNFLLKFNHGVEVGAHRAYMGHYWRTDDPEILAIAVDELEHQKTLADILKYYGDTPCPYMDGAFRLVGRVIGWLCRISPEFALNRVASVMELFAVFSYSYVALVYTDFEYTFRHMAKTELKHQKYFKGEK